MLAHCDVFLSTDSRVLKYKTEKLQISNPAAFILERGSEK